MEGGYNLRNPAVKRLMREAQELKDKTEQFSAYPLEDNLFEWHFTIRGPADSDFENGLYHGRIVLPPEYPMKPPSIILLTPSGRFETNRKICLSISGFHPESWQPSWSLRTALLGIIGFMPTHGNGAIGSLDYTSEERKVLARKSQDWKCPHCGPVRDLVLPVTELSRELNKEAMEIGQQINMQGEKPKSQSEESSAKESESDGATGGSSTSPPSSIPSEPVASSAQSPPSCISSLPPTSAMFMLPQPPSYLQALFQRPVLPPSTAPGSLPGAPPIFPWSFPPPMFMPMYPPNMFNATHGFTIPSTSSQSAGQVPLLNPFVSPQSSLFMPSFSSQLLAQPISPLSQTLGTTLASSPAATTATVEASNVAATASSAKASQAVTVTVSYQSTAISSPGLVNNSGARPKEPLTKLTSSTSSASGETKQQNVSSLPIISSDKQPVSPTLVKTDNTVKSLESEKDPQDEKKSEVSSDTSKSSSSTSLSSPLSTSLSNPSTAPSTTSCSPSSDASTASLDRSDDGDPVPLASNLRHRSDNTASKISRTNVPTEPINSTSNGSRHRYTTRAGLMEAAVDMFVIFLLFCIFGLLARRASMFL